MNDAVYTVGQAVQVHAFGCWYDGLVEKITAKRITVIFSTGPGRTARGVSRRKVVGKLGVRANRIVGDGTYWVNIAAADTWTTATRQPRRLVPCTGAAHTNPMIDNCGVCLNHGGRWGLMAVLSEVAG